jgi:membrane protein DedA with SNARE-associated domain/rhodanese-related sulfurtransferase
VNAIVHLLVKHGYSVLFVSVFARQMWLPVPAILFLIAAGALADSGRMTLAFALGLAVVACLLADMVWYEAGRRWGDQILHFIYGLGYLLGKDLDHAATYGARLGLFWVILVSAALAMYLSRKLVRWHRFVRESRLARITPEELKKKMDAGEQVIIVDLHGCRDGPRGHRGIPGAVCLDPHRLRQRDNLKNRTQLPRDRELVLYCTTLHEFTSARAALELRRRGFERVRPLAGGLQAWHERGFPMTSVILRGST